MKKMDLLVKRLARNMVAVCSVSLDNFNKIESPVFDVKKDFANVIEVALHSYDTWDKAMSSITFYCENRYIAAYIIRLMRKDLKASGRCLVQNTELYNLLDDKEFYDRVINWKASNGMYVLHLNEVNEFGNMPAKYFKLPLSIAEFE